MKILKKENSEHAPIKKDVDNDIKIDVESHSLVNALYDEKNNNNSYNEKSYSPIKKNKNTNFEEEKLKCDEEEKQNEKNKLISNEENIKIESMIEQALEIEYENLKKFYEEKIEDLLYEQENVFNKNEIIKAKYSALEQYLINFCRQSNIDYESLIDI